MRVLFLLVFGAVALPIAAQTACSPTGRPGAALTDGWRLDGYTLESYQGAWVPNSTMSITWDAAGDAVLMTTDTGGGNVDVETRTFDALHRVLTFASTAVQTPSREYHYASPTEAEERYGWRGGTDWDTFFDRSLYAYDSECRLQQRRDEHRPAGTWAMVGRTDYTYDAGRLTTITSYGDNFGSIPPDQPAYLSTYMYSGERLSQVESSTWDPATTQWTPRSLTVYAYTASGLLQSTERFNSIGGTWAPSSRNDYTYTTEGNRATWTSLYWQDGSYRPSLRYLYTYEAAPVTAGPGPDVVAKLTVVGANPSAVATRVRLRLSAPEVVAVTVHDALGRAVATLYRGALPAGDHEWETGSSFAPGVYVVRVQGTTARGTVRVVRSR